MSFWVGIAAGKSKQDGLDSLEIGTHSERNWSMSLLLQKLEQFVPSVSQDQQKRFRDEVCHQNVVRLQIMSWVNVVINTVLLVIELLSPADHAIATGLQTYIAVRLAMVALCFSFVLVARRPRSSKEIVLRHYLAVIGAVTLLCILAAVWAGLIQLWVPTITFYLIIVFSLASFVSLSAWESGLALGLGLAVLIVLINHFQADPLIRTHNVINGTVLTVLAFCVGQLGWWSGVQRFLDRLTIEGQARELRRLSFEDELTGLANRRQAEQKLAKEWARGVRSNRPLSLIMIDVDHFKAFNDTYGHIMGDEVLRQLAQALKREVKRSADLVTRYGGEEFLVLLVETDAVGAQYIAGALKQAVWDLGVVHSGSEYGRVTISLGVATAHCKAGETPQVLLETADKALYQAKQRGRNQVVAR